MDLVGSIITWVIGLPVALILGCFLGVGAFLLLQKHAGNRVVRERIMWASFAVALIGFVGVVWLLGSKWLLLEAVFVLPLTFGYAMGIHTSK